MSVRKMLRIELDKCSSAKELAEDEWIQKHFKRGSGQEHWTKKPEIIKLPGYSQAN